VAWNAALGGYAIAHNIAVGGIANALQANNPLANHWLAANPFFRISSKALPYLFCMNLLWIIPLAIQRNVVKRTLRSRGQARA
jgi:hypothetical protein